MRTAPTGRRQRTTIAATTERLSAFRHWIRSALDAVPWLHRERIEEIVLASSELASNAVEHGSGDEVHAEIETSDHAVLVTVESDGALPDDAWSARRLDPTTIGGRGLMIVRSVADSVNRVVSAGRTSVTARFDRRR